MKKILSYKYSCFIFIFMLIAFTQHSRAGASPPPYIDVSLLLSVEDLDLEALQDIQDLFVHGGVHGGREGGIHDDAGLRVLGLEDAGVGDHADVADQAHQLDLIGLGGEDRGGGRVGDVHAENQRSEEHTSEL